MTSALDGGEWSASRPGRFIPGERSPGIHWIGGGNRYKNCDIGPQTENNVSSTTACIFNLSPTRYVGRVTGVQMPEMLRFFSVCVCVCVCVWVICPLRRYTPHWSWRSFIIYDNLVVTELQYVIFLYSKIVPEDVS
jgi:hypothetical protein